MLKTELKTNQLKKGIGAFRVAQRWHNKNKSGGNFGINIYFAEEFCRETDTEITGYYNSDGKITSLSYGFLYQCGTRLPTEAFETMEDLIKYINEWRE